MLQIISYDTFTGINNYRIARHDIKIVYNLNA